VLDALLNMIWFYLQDFCEQASISNICCFGLIWFFGLFALLAI